MNRRILVVDDEKDIRYMGRTALEENGYECVEAVDGREAIEIAGKERPALIIMDLVMDGMDGVDAFGALKIDHSTKNIPVITYTAHPMEVAKK